MCFFNSYTFAYLCVYGLFKGWSGLMYVHAKHLNKVDEVMYFSFSNMISNKTKMFLFCVKLVKNS